MRALLWNCCGNPIVRCVLRAHYAPWERKAAQVILMLVTPAGFEPATIRLEGECSIQLSYGAVSGAIAGLCGCCNHGIAFEWQPFMQGP